jgi:hypothetical protein
MDESPASITERLARIEITAHFERERTDYLIGDISRRLLALEMRGTTPPAGGGTLKYAIAILLPLAVLLATGDLATAARALRLALGSPT